MVLTTEATWEIVVGPVHHMATTACVALWQACVVTNRVEVLGSGMDAVADGTAFKPIDGGGIYFPVSI